MGSCIWRAGTITSRGRPGSCTSASGRYWRGSAVALPRVSGTAFSRDRPRAGPSGGLRGPGGPPERRQVDPSQPARGREDGHRLAPAADDTDTDHRHQAPAPRPGGFRGDRKSTRLNSSHSQISYAVFCLKKKKPKHDEPRIPSPFVGAPPHRLLIRKTVAPTQWTGRTASLASHAATAPRTATIQALSLLQ